MFQNDLISWLLDVAEGEERTVPALVQRILVINFGAVHTSANVSANCDMATRSSSPIFIRHLPTHSSIWLPSPRPWRKCERKLIASSKKMDGPKCRWVRCTKLTVFCANPSDTVATASVGLLLPGPSYLSLHRMAASMGRKVVKPGGFTFSDGTTVPQGCYVNVATGPTHSNPGTYIYLPDWVSLNVAHRCIPESGRV